MNLHQLLVTPEPTLETAQKGKGGWRISETRIYTGKPVMGESGSIPVWAAVQRRRAPTEERQEWRELPCFFSSNCPELGHWRHKTSSPCSWVAPEDSLLLQGGETREVPRKARPLGGVVWVTEWVVGSEVVGWEEKASPDHNSRGFLLRGTFSLPLLSLAMRGPT